MGIARKRAQRPTARPLPATPAGDAGSMRMDVSGLSDRGPRRPTNQDYFLVGRVGRSLELVCSNLPPGTVPESHTESGYGMLVADGIGGSLHGGKASLLAVQTLFRLIVDTPDWILRANDDRAERELLRRAGDRYAAVNRVLAEAEQRDPDLRGWGTTLTAALSLGTQLYIAHVGDSRAYLLRSGKLVRLTRDHTLAATLAEAGVRVLRKGETQRLHHLLTRYIGSKDPAIKTDLLKVRVRRGDCVLLCTDGLSNSVPDKVIAKLLAKTESAHAACEALIGHALARHTDDNVTVVVGRFLGA